MLFGVVGGEHVAGHISHINLEAGPCDGFITAADTMGLMYCLTTILHEVQQHLLHIAC